MQDSIDAGVRRHDRVDDGLLLLLNLLRVSSRIFVRLRGLSLWVFFVRLRGLDCFWKLLIQVT